MDSRRKRRREEKLLETMKKFRDERPKISDQFADLKGELQGVSFDAWDAIPEVGDHSLKHKQKRRADIYTPLPTACSPPAVAKPRRSTRASRRTAAS